MDILTERYRAETAVTENSTILAERHVSYSRGTIIYRLSVEPRRFLRRERTRYYTVTVIKLSQDKKSREILRDFTDNRAEAESFVGTLADNAVMPEHLYDVYEDVFSVWR